MFKRIITILAAAASLFFIGLSPAVAAVDCSSTGLSAQDALACGANNGDSNSDTETKAAGTKLGTTISDVINVMSAAVAIISVIMLILGGLRFVSSGGSQEAVAGARKTIIFSLVGLAITAVAQIIVQFVINRTS